MLLLLIDIISSHVPYNVMRWVPDIMHCIGLDSQGLRLHETLLFNQNFDRRQNIAGHKGPHSRFMKPGCKFFSSTTNLASSYDSAATTGQLEQLSIFVSIGHCSLHLARF